MEEGNFPTRRWEDLKIDILVKILQASDFFEMIFVVSQVCRSWRLACSNQDLWKTLDLSVLQSNFIRTQIELITRTGICSTFRRWEDLESLTMPSILNPASVIQEIGRSCRNFAELKIMGPCDMRFATALVGYRLQQITYVVQQISDLFLLFLTDYSSTAIDPQVIDRIRKKLSGATTITRKIILEGAVVVVDDGSGSGTYLTVFERINHYDYDHTSYTDFATYSECSACKCQDCKTKYDGVINAINALTASVKKMTSKRGVIPSKRISYPYTPLEIKVAKRRRKGISKASSSIKKSKVVTLLSLFCTFDQCTRVTGEQHELKKVDVTVKATATTTTKTNLVYSHTVGSGEGSMYAVHTTTSEEIERLFHGRRKSIALYIPINYGDEFHWVLAVVILKERYIRVYDSMSQRRHSGTSSELQKLAKILPTYLDMSSFLYQKVCTNWLTIEAYWDKVSNPFDIEYVEGIAQQSISSL
ncbi:hypothetical protein T459_09310 [Capsicum annuum]|uniref:Ubiquitin-like protease family profile domain-containing protein n=1 Tax=Capsicum annuum TaxID=4072 RepID=A0A2G2ZZ03_CAPAN|nr:hypothetical protein T459_09310 [Capsicum annuum]